MKYRKRPVVIEAFQFDGDFMDSNGNYYVPEWAASARRISLCAASPPKHKEI